MADARPHRTVAPEARAAAEGLARGVTLALGDDAVAVIVLGSAVFPGFSPNLVDIDFHVVVRAELTDVQKDALAAMHADLAEAVPLGRLIDGYYLPLAKARRSEVPAGLVGAGEGQVNRGTARNGGWALERAHVHAGAFALLLGADPRGIYPPPSEDELAAALAEELAVIAREHAAAPAYAVLNLARIACTRSTGRVAISKLDAARWAVEALPTRFRPAIRAALREYAGQADERERGLVRRAAPALLGLVASGGS